ncbi:MAG: helix-turn-helix transcriptional regulator [Alphaproteobacteria bacterium]|nr:helix-turn-helix transcriptional regulator [Alphaproteobacteria bacterium]
MTFILQSQQEVAQAIALRAKTVRLKQNLTQEGLSLRSGVSLGSIKRFERTGEISLKSLIDIALALGNINDLELLFKIDDKPVSLFDNKNTKERKRGGIK